MGRSSARKADHDSCQADENSSGGKNTKKHDIWSQRHVRQARQQAQPQPGQHQHHRVGHAQAVGHFGQRRGHGQQDYQEFDFVHRGGVGRGESNKRTSC